MYTNRRGTISDRSHLLVSPPTLVCFANLMGKQQHMRERGRVLYGANDARTYVLNNKNLWGS